MIEAIPEDVSLKIATMRSIEAAVADDAVIATNTSSISLDLLGDEMRGPERLTGLHFFNPAPASKLIEVVVAGRTRTGLADSAAEWVRELGKTPVVVRNAPGFASSRLGIALGLVGAGDDGEPAVWFESGCGLAAPRTVESDELGRTENAGCAGSHGWL